MARKQIERTYQYEDCRDLRHAWMRMTDEVLYDENHAALFTRSVACERCQTVRIDTYKVPKSGPHVLVRMGSRYHYAKDYVVKGGYDVAGMRWRLYQRATGKLRAISNG
jgi:hypothetical protein